MSIAKTSRIISLLSVILLLFTGYCVYDLRNNIIRQHYVDAERTTLQTLTKELQESSIELTVAARNYAVTGNQAYIDAYNHVVDVRSGKKAREKTKFVAPEETISLLDLSRKNGCTDREMELLNEVMQRSILLAKLEAQAFELGRQGKFDEAKAIMYGEAYEKQRAEVAKPVYEFDDILVARLMNESQAAAAAVRSNLTLVGITIMLNIVLALFSAFFSNQRIVRRLEICSSYARSLAEGNYDQNLSARYPDELGTMVNALNVMVDSLKARIGEAQKAMEHAKERQGEAEVAMKQAEAAKAQAERAKRDGMLQAANDLSSVVDAVSDVSKALSDGIVRSDNGAKEQAHLALETAGSMEEMKGAVNAVAKSASDAANASAHVKQKAQEGVEQVAQVTDSMSELSHAATKISEDIHALGKQADGIGAILSVISDIADQTNLLALNAAIEAARAGEAGRGFAVVADEVRKLAEKTMSATHEVSQAIGSIQESVRENITSVTATGEMAQRVTEIVQHSGQVLDEILHLAEASADQVSAIAAASEEQSASGEHISRSVDTISTIANQTADTMHEADNAVKELLQQAGRLSHLIDEMKRG